MNTDTAFIELDDEEDQWIEVHDTAYIDADGDKRIVVLRVHNNQEGASAVALTSHTIDSLISTLQCFLPGPTT